MQVSDKGKYFVVFSLILILIFSQTSCTGKSSVVINPNKTIEKAPTLKKEAIVVDDVKTIEPDTTTLPAVVTKRIQSDISIKVYSYLQNLKNREDVKDVAKALNGGDQHNSCVYFASEVLRRQGLNIPKSVCSTGSLSNDPIKNISLIYTLQNDGWKVDYDLKNLLPGDFCFTTNDSQGRPTHVYVFMGWAAEGRYDYANVCDNQSYDYGLTLHKRNINIALPGKEATAFFMYYPK